VLRVRGRDIDATMIAIATRRNAPTSQRGTMLRSGDLHSLSDLAVGFWPFSSRSRP
jgi:hypothetical protein